MVFLWFSSVFFVAFPWLFLWFSHGFPMVFLWFSYCFPMVFLLFFSWFSYGFPMVFQRFSYAFSMVFLWFYYGFPMVFPLSFLWFFHGFPMVFLCFFLWFFPQFSFAFPTVFLYISCGFRILFLWFSHGFPCRSQFFAWVAQGPHFSSIFIVFWSPLDRLRDPLGTHLGPPWAHLGLTWGPIGSLRRHLGPTLGDPWDPLGPRPKNIQKRSLRLHPFGTPFFTKKYRFFQCKLQSLFWLIFKAFLGNFRNVFRVKKHSKSSPEWKMCFFENERLAYTRAHFSRFRSLKINVKYVKKAWWKMVDFLSVKLAQNQCQNDLKKQWK